MKKITVALIAAALSGCASAPTETQKVVEVDKPVAVSCLGTIPARPTYMYGKGVEPSDIEKGGILIKDFEAAEKYGTDWEAATAGCLTLPPQQNNPPSPSTSQ